MIKKNNNLFVLADLHIGSSRVSDSILKQAFQNMENIDSNAAYIIDGDITTSGKQKDFNDAWNLFREEIPGSAIKLISLGNHDVRGPYTEEWTNNVQDDPQYFKQTVTYEYQKNYLEKSDYLNIPKSKNYFSYITRHINYITINSEKGLKDAFYLTSEQYDWLEKQLRYGVDNNLLNMLIVHQPLNDTHPGSNENGGFGFQDDVLKKLLKVFPDTIILSGHIHNGLNTHAVKKRAYGICVDIPGLSVSESEYIGDAIGYYVKIEKDCLKFQSWDFFANKHLEKFDFSIKTEF